MTRTQDRRTILKWAMLGGGVTLARLLAGPLAYAAAPTSKEQDAHAAFDRATRGMPSPRIKDVSVIQVGSNGINDSTVVKVTTDQAGLYGYGCATATFPGGRAKLVAAAVDRVSEAPGRRPDDRSDRADLAALLHELLLQE